MRILLTLLVALLLVPVASAKNYKADIFLNPNPTDVGIETTAYGCGYDPNKLIWLQFVFYPEYDGSNGGYAVYITADANGCFSQTFTPTGDGYYEIWAIQRNKTDNAWQVRSKIEWTIE